MTVACKEDLLALVSLFLLAIRGLSTVRRRACLSPASRRVRSSERDRGVKKRC